MKLAKFEGYYDDAKGEFEALEKKLNHNLAKDLDYNKQTLKKSIDERPRFSLLLPKRLLRE